MTIKPIDPQMLESLRIRYGEVKIEPRMRDQIEQLESLSKKVNNVLGAWKVTSKEARELTALFSWHEGESYSPYTTKKLTDDGGVPTEEIVGKMDRAFTALEPLASLLNEIVGFKVKGKKGKKGGRVEGSFKGKSGKPGSPALRDLIESLIPYWEDREESSVTFSRRGSQFELFVQDVVNKIDDTAIIKVHEVLADVLRKRRENRSAVDDIQL